MLLQLLQLKLLLELLLQLQLLLELLLQRGREPVCVWGVLLLQQLQLRLYMLEMQLLHLFFSFKFQCLFFLASTTCLLMSPEIIAVYNNSLSSICGDDPTDPTRDTWGPKSKICCSTAASCCTS